MAIKVESQGSIPAIDLNHLQFVDTHIKVNKTHPYHTAISGYAQMYGVDLEGVRHYDEKTGPQDITLRDVDSFIMSITDPEKQALAIQGMGLVQQGLGILAQIKLGIPFVEVG